MIQPPISTRNRRRFKKAARISALLIGLLLLSGCFQSGQAVDQPAAVSSAPAASGVALGATPAASALPTLPPTAAPAPLEPTLTLAPTPTVPVINLAETTLPVGGRSYVLPLTIRHVTADSAVLLFELDQPAEGALYFQQIAPALLAPQTVALTPGAARQQFTLQNLAPGAEYQAVVALSGAGGVFEQPAFMGEAWGHVRFRTASGEEPLRVGVFGDASFGDPASEALMAQMLSQNLDFAVHTGDVVALIYENNGPIEAYALKFYKTLAPLLHVMPVYTVPGNHDYDAAARWQDSYFYYYAFPPFYDPRFTDAPQQAQNQYYAFAYNDVQFIMLDSQVLFGIPGREQEEAWLAGRLADPRFRFSIPIFHVPPFFSSAVHPDDQLPVRAVWHPILSAANVPLSFSGHSHHYERSEAGGVTYIVSGGGSAILYAQGQTQSESQIYARRTHFVLMEIYTDRVELSAIDKLGEVFDRVVVPVTGSAAQP